MSESSLKTQRDALAEWLRAHASAYPVDSTGRSNLPHAAATWAHSHSITDVRALHGALRDAGISPLPDRRTLAVVWKRARRHVTERSAASTPQGRAAARLRVARRTVARVLTPLDPDLGVRAADTAHLRRAMAIIGLAALRGVDEDRDGRLAVTAPWLERELGVSELTARRLLRTMAADLRWLAEVKQLSGGARVYRLTRLDQAAGTVADAHRDTITALAERTANPVAAAIATAAHPVWGYASPGRAAWIVAVADAAGIRGADAQAIGASRTTAAGIRRWLAEVRSAGQGDLAAGLDTVGQREDVGRRIAEQRAIKAAAAAERAERQRARLAALAERTGRRQAARQLILNAAGPLGAGVGADGARAWLRVLRDELAKTSPVAGDVRATVAELVAADLEHEGVAVDAAGRAAGMVTAGLAVREVAAA